MSDLKTLKDMPFIKESVINCFPPKKEYTKAFLESDLRQEAIKWIKWYNSGGQYKQPEFNNFAFNCSDAAEIVPFIKYFFNITEEDLK